MPRAIWSGAISFGLVNIPIKLYSAVSRKSVHFNQIDTRTGARIKHKQVSEADGEEVPSEAIAKGYQLSSGEYVLVSDDELGALDPEASAQRSTSRSSSTSPTSTRSSTTPPTTSRPTRRR